MLFQVMRISLAGFYAIIRKKISPKTTAIKFRGHYEILRISITMITLTNLRDIKKIYS